MESKADLGFVNNYINPLHLYLVEILHLSQRYPLGFRLNLEMPDISVLLLRRKCFTLKEVYYLLSFSF